MRPVYLTIIGLFFCGINAQVCGFIPDPAVNPMDPGIGLIMRADVTLFAPHSPITPPTASDASVSLTENSGNGASVHTVSATDPDVGDVLSYAITGGNTNAAFVINASTGEITVNNSSALDFEVTPSFALTVQVSDGSLFDDALITVNLTDVNESPSAADATVILAENAANGAAVHTVSATDPDAGAILSYAIIAGNTNTAFAINTGTGEITVNNSSVLDFETTPSFALTVQVSDGSLFDDALITVNLTDVNEAPSATDATASFAENSANGTAVHTVSATDPDAGAVLTYAIIGGNTNTAFAINGSSGAITVNNSSALNFETTPSFALTVRVSDGSLFDDALITVNLTNVNESPSAADATVGLAENAANATAVHTVSAIDPDAATVLTYSIIAGNTSAAFAINTNTGEITVNNSSVLDFETITSFALTVRVSDGTFFDDALITINLINVNEWTPVAADATVSLAEHAPNGTVAHKVIGTDADAGAVLTYTIIAGNTEAAFGIISSTGLIRVENFRDVDFEETPTFVLTVRVSDGTLFRDVFITVNVTNVNEAPSAADATVSRPENSANGTAVHTVSATDPDAGAVLTYSITAGNINAAFAINASTGAITVNNSSALNFETTPSFSLTVRVSDGSLFDDALITVNLTNVNDAPSAADATISLQENAANGTAVHTVSATDQDAGAILTYSITSGNTSTAFAINASTGAITVNNSAVLNIETTPSFALTVRVSDGSLFDDALITVNLTDVNEGPPSAADATVSLAENTANATIVHGVSAADPDAGAVLTYSITAGNTNTAFAINASSGAITVNNSGVLDFETTTAFVLTVRVSDGSLFDDAVITVNLTDVNESPSATDATISFAENAVNGTAVHTVSATDPDAGAVLTYSITAGNISTAFAINTGTGEITVNNSSALNFETSPSFALTVRVSDGSLFHDALITVNLTDVNESPSATDATVSIAENAGNATFVHSVSATDPDAGATLTYSIISGNTNTAFAINTSTGDITVNNSSALDFEAITSFVLTVRYSDGTFSDDALITVDLINVNEWPPSAADATVTLAENAANATTVHTVTGTDADAGAVLTYAITMGNANTAFAIDANTGEITVGNSGALDFETTPSFVLTVRVSDGTLFDDVLVTVNLTNVNEVPSATDETVSLAENATNGTVVHTVSGFDPDAGDLLTYAITGGNASTAFAINTGTGMITVDNSLAVDFETTSTFTLTVRVSDGGLFDDVLITVNLTDVNEVPFAPDATVSLAENTANGSAVHSVLATDPDGNAVLTYAIAGGNVSDAFAINSGSGVITVNNSAALNFESMSGFTLKVEVGDGIFAAEATIQVNVADVNEAPAISSATVSISENAPNGTFIHSVEASDPDRSTSVLIYSIVGGNTSNAFVIGSDGQISVNNSSALNFETAGSFTIKIKVSDGALSSEALVTINLLDINEPPNVSDATVHIDEGLEEGTIVYRVEASDADANDVITFSLEPTTDNPAFSIDATTGDLTIQDKEQIKFDVNPEFQVAVLAMDVQGATGAGIITIQLNKIAGDLAIEPLKGFSPNGDRNNDFWVIKGIEAFPDNEVKVFNRWGNLVFETRNYDNEDIVWRGEANGPLVLNGNDPTDNTYFFIIRAGDLDPISGYVIVKN